MLRQFLQHPIEIPIQLLPSGEPVTTYRCRQTISRGGLSCYQENYIEPGSWVEILLPLMKQAPRIRGLILWCQKKARGYSMGIVFSEPEQVYSVRMIEQVCQIEHYRLQQQRCGRQLTPEQSAHEWVARHAADFPTVESLR